MNEHDFDEMIRRHANKLEQERGIARRGRLEEMKPRRKTGPDVYRRIESLLTVLVELAKKEPRTVMRAMVSKRRFARLMHSHLGYHSEEAAEKFLQRYLSKLWKTKPGQVPD